MHGRAEDVHADEGQVALRLPRLLLQTNYLAGVIQLRYAEFTRIGHRREHDLSVWPLGTELLHQGGDAADDEVVAEVHDEIIVAEEVPGYQDRVGQAERRLLPDIR